MNSRGPVVFVYGHKGTHDVAGDYEGPLVKSNLESVVFQQQEKVSSLILCSSSRS